MSFEVFHFELDEVYSTTIFRFTFLHTKGTIDKDRNNLKKKLKSHVREVPDQLILSFENALVSRHLEALRRVTVIVGGGEGEQDKNESLSPVALRSI